MAAQHHFRLSQRHQQAKTWPSNTTDELSVADRPRHGLMPMRFSPSASSASHGLACSRRHHLHQRVHLSHFAKHTATRGRPHIRTAHSQHTTATHNRNAHPQEGRIQRRTQQRPCTIDMPSGNHWHAIKQASNRHPPSGNETTVTQQSATPSNAQPVRSATAAM